MNQYLLIDLIKLWNVSICFNSFLNNQLICLRIFISSSLLYVWRTFIIAQNFDFHIWRINTFWILENPKKHKISMVSMCSLVCLFVCGDDIFWTNSKHCGIWERFYFILRKWRCQGEFRIKSSSSSKTIIILNLNNLICRMKKKPRI